MSQNDGPTVSSIGLLLIDDDVELCELMGTFLGSRGFHVTSIHDGLDGLRMALKRTFDLIVLDVMLPGVDGFEVLAQLKQRTSVPVIMLTARKGPADRIAGLDGGADDYLPKPFNPHELVSRMRAVLRRVDGSGSLLRPLQVGQLVLERSERHATFEGRTLDLTAFEFDILAALMRHAGRVVSRTELLKALTQRPTNAFERTLDVHISHIRQKLGPRGRDAVKTVRGIGYIVAKAEP